MDGMWFGCPFGNWEHQIDNLHQVEVWPKKGDKWTSAPQRAKAREGGVTSPLHAQLSPIHRYHHHHILLHLHHVIRSDIGSVGACSANVQGLGFCPWAHEAADLVGQGILLEPCRRAGHLGSSRGSDGWHSWPPLAEDQWRRGVFHQTHCRELCRVPG